MSHSATCCRDAFSSAWAAVKRGGSSVGRIRLPAPHLPSLPRPHLWWRSSDPGVQLDQRPSPPATVLVRRLHTLHTPGLSQEQHARAAPGLCHEAGTLTALLQGSLLSCCAAAAAGQAQLALMRQRSIALQQAVAQSRLGSAVAKSRFASASRRWGTRLQPLVNAKVAGPALRTPSWIHARAAAWLFWLDAVLAGWCWTRAGARPSLVWMHWSGCCVRASSCVRGSARLEAQAVLLVQVLLRTVWAGARCVARWALGTFWAAPRPAMPPRQRLPRLPPGPVILPASPLDGGLRPY